LVAELFREEDEAVLTQSSSAKTKHGGPLVRASKDAQKSTQQQRQLKKTVGSQVLVMYTVYCADY